MFQRINYLAVIIHSCLFFVLFQKKEEKKKTPLNGLWADKEMPHVLLNMNIFKTGVLFCHIHVIVYSDNRFVIIYFLVWQAYSPQICRWYLKCLI